MDKMQFLLDGHQPCMLFEHLFLDQMPDSIRLRLADADFTDSHRVAEQADELWLSMDQNSSSVMLKATYPHQQDKAKENSANTNTEQCSTRTGMETRQGGVSKLTSIRVMGRPAVSISGGQPFQKSPSLCPRLSF